MNDITPRSKGTASRALSVFLRLFELVCSAIVLGLIARKFYLIDNAGVTNEPNGRLVFAAVIASLTILWSIFSMPPLAYSFWLFPLDFFFFAAWLVVFCVLETLTGIDTCDSQWFNTYWGYYWGRWYLVAPPGGSLNINWTGCSAWRSVLAFSFLACIMYLLSFFLGVYWVIEHGRIKERHHRYTRHMASLHKRKRQPAGTAAATGGVMQQPPPTITTTGPAGEPLNVQHGPPLASSSAAPAPALAAAAASGSGSDSAPAPLSSHPPLSPLSPVGSSAGVTGPTTHPGAVTGTGAGTTADASTKV